MSALQVNCPECGAHLDAVVNTSTVNVERTMNGYVISLSVSAEGFVNHTCQSVSS